MQQQTPPSATYDHIGQRFARLGPAQRRAVYLKISAEGLGMGQFPVTVRDAALREVCPPSYAQLRQWFLWQLDPESPAYHIAGGLRLQGPLDTAALRASFDALVARHEALRTVFAADAQGVLTQQVRPSGAVDFRCTDLRGRPDAQAAADAAVRDCSEAPFDLTAGPLLRVGVVRLTDDEHLLVVVMHHIVSDGWSMRLVVDEFVAQYRARVLGQPLETPPLPVQYADCALWQRQWLEAGEQERQLQYWKAQLGEVHPVLQLPTDHARRADGRYRAARHTLALPAALVAALRQRAQAEGATLFMALLAALQVLLYRYTGQHDVRVGVPIAGRRRIEAEGVIGLFVNTQVLRSVIDGRTPLRHALHAARDAALGAQAHQDLPFEELVDALQPERTPGTPPLFQVLFNHQQEDFTALHTLPGITLSPHALGEPPAHFELALNAVEDRDGALSLGLDYARELFDAPTVERMGAHLQCLLEALAHRPETPVGEIDLLQRDEAETLALWGSNLRPEGSWEPVHRLVQRRAQQAPGATALIFGGEPVSYGELERRANRFAQRLIALGVRPEDRVGIALERSVELVVGLLGTLKAGAAYVPLDTEYPAERLAYMARDSGIALLVTRGPLRARVPVGEGVRVLDIERDHALADGEDPGAPALAVHAGQLAYVIYTSGSTGQPKGVMVAHGPFADHCVDTAAIYEMGPQSRELHFLSFSFDGAHERLFTALCCGASLLLRDAALWSAEQTLDAIGRHGVTHAGFPPVYLRQLAEWARETGRCPDVDLYSFGGEAMPREGFDAVRRHLKPRLLINGYGPTEAVVTPMLWKTDANAAFGEGYAPIGRPVAGRRALVLDTDMNRVPRQVAGELYLGGTGLARGYLGRAALSAERFVADPFDAAGGRLYRTGDWVRWREDGQLEYLGRIDHQVKVRGFRIELGEIEARLLEQPEVRQAVAVAAPGQRGTRLVAYVTPKEGAAVEAAALRARLAASLPDYMVPAAIMVIAALPLGPGGKLDRSALPAPEPERAAAGEPPRGAAEEALAAVWREVLGLPQVGRDDNFFELGGDSILSLQIVARLRLAGWKASPRQVFERQTVALLAAVMEPAGLADAAAPAGGVPSQVEGDVPLLPFQRDFFAMPMPRRNHWNQSVLLQAGGAIDRAALRDALAALEQHHDALRLRFEPLPQGGWRQSYAAFDAAQQAELLWLRSAADAAELAALCEEAQRSLDLTGGPLWRALAVEMADGSQRLLLAIHHLVVDGVSWRALLEDLQRAYRQRLAGQPVALPPKSSSVKDWSLALQGHAAAHADEMAHWLALGDVPVGLPCARPEAPNTVRYQEAIEIRLGRAETEALLKQAPAAYRTQVNDLLLTALGRALCGWSGHTQLRIDLEGHGREDLYAHIDLSRTVGWFTALFPVALAPLGALGDAIRRVKEGLRAVPNKGLGHAVFRHLGSAQQREALAAQPRSQVVFNYLGQFDGGFGEEALWRPAPEAGGAQVDADAPLTHEFSVDGQVLEGELSLRVSFSAARHDAAQVQAWMQALRDELQAIIRHCAAGPQGCSPSDFPLAALSQAQLDALALPPAAVADLYPLSPMQSGMLFQTLLETGGAAYQNQLRLDLHALDAARWRAAWRFVFGRHEVLRSAFVQREEGPLQWLDRTVQLPWREEDGRGRPAAALDALAADEAACGFDLARAPLMRCVLVQTGPQRHHFIWTVHHLLLDGWSTGLLLGDVLRHYGGQAPAAPAGRFRDYIGWIARQDAAASERYWRGEIARLDGPTRLADALLRPARALEEDRVEGHRFGARRHDLSAAETQALVDFARRERVTLNTLVQAAWALLLQRYARQDAVVFGSTVAGRPAELAGVEGIVGLFINTLPVIVSARPGQAVGDWLRELQARNLAMREHEHTPLYAIQRWAQAPAPGLFDSIVVFENYPADQALHAELPGGLSAEVVAQHEAMHYPMTVKAVLEPSLQLQFHHALALIGESQAQAIARHTVRLLQALAADAARPVGAIGLLDDAEARVASLLHAGATPGLAAEPDAPQPQALHQRVAAWAAAQPEAIALVFEGLTLSYGELDARANRIAHALIAQGVAPEDRVGVACERGIDLVVALLAVLKAGAAYVPLDPHYPADRVAYMAQDSGLRLVLAQGHLLPGLRLPAGIAVLAVEPLAQAPCPAAAPAVAVSPDALAYVIYTSGSTGRPKGAQLSHRNVTRLLDRTVPWFGFGPQDTWTLFHSYAFDFSVWEIFGALCTGGRLVVVPHQVSRSPEDFERLLRRERVTVLNQTPSAFGQLAQLPQALAPGLSLRWVIFGGEALDPQRLRGWISQHGDAAPQLANMYGITETTVHVTFRRITAADVAGTGSPIGTAIPDLELRVLDAQLHPVPVGVAGELHVAGAGLARGYLNRPSLTAERFVATAGGERLYRTGDLARRTPGGDIEYLGRIDHQVKLRGFRIELGEIEAELLAQPEVREAVVLALGEGGAMQLVAYLSAQPGRSIDTAALRSRLAGRLPEHMLPSVCMVLPALPLNANGKVDRKALPAPERTSARAHAAPQGETEQALAAAWAEVLEIERVGRHDDFFELGGHSLTVLGVQARMQRRLGVQAPLRLYFEHPQLIALAAALDAARHTARQEAAEDLTQMAALLAALED